jgi:hypothetical protein
MAIPLVNYDVPRGGKGIAYVYCLCDPETKEVRYVGCTERPFSRLATHIADGHSQNNPRAIWMRELGQKGMVPLMVILERVRPDVRVISELYWTHFFAFLGAELLNSDHIPRIRSVIRLPGAPPRVWKFPRKVVKL